MSQVPIVARVRCVELQEYEILRTTPKGVWIRRGSSYGLHGDERFVLLGARKRFACPTKEEALESFIARKKAQKRIYEARARHAERALKIAKNMVGQPEHDGSEWWYPLTTSHTVVT